MYSQDHNYLVFHNNPVTAYQAFRIKKQNRALTTNLYVNLVKKEIQKRGIQKLTYRWRGR